MMEDLAEKSNLLRSSWKLSSTVLGPQWSQGGPKPVRVFLDPIWQYGCTMDPHTADLLRRYLGPPSLDK